MRMYPRKFPPGRRKNPKRRAERRVYETLAGSDCQGFAFYEWRKGYERIELDYAVWVQDLGRFALQVKGGRYALIDGDWHLKTREGVKAVGSCPLDEAKLAKRKGVYVIWGAEDVLDDLAEIVMSRSVSDRSSEYGIGKSRDPTICGVSWPMRPEPATGSMRREHLE